MLCSFSHADVCPTLVLIVDIKTVCCIMMDRSDSHSETTSLPQSIIPSPDSTVKPAYISNASLTSKLPRERTGVCRCPCCLSAVNQTHSGMCSFKTRNRHRPC